jgi:hypothetical protein
MTYKSALGAGAVLLFVMLASACQGGGSSGDDFYKGSHAVGLISTSLETISGGPYRTVNSVFLPNTRLFAGGVRVDEIASCHQQEIEGCKVYVAQPCPMTCDEGEYCGLQADCTMKCVKSCSVFCQTNEECFIDDQGEPACRVREVFDAGEITISGGSSEDVTLEGQSDSWASTTGTDPFGPGTTMKIAAEGSAKAGFGPFETQITIPASIRMQPPLDETTTLSEIYGDEDIEIRWPASFETVTLSGRASTAASDPDVDVKSMTFSCSFEDSAGKGVIPRAIFDAIGGKFESLFITLTRKASTTIKGVATVGSLGRESVEKEGWVRVEASSEYNYSLVGCAPLATCDTCVDLRSNRLNCGECGRECDSTEECVNGSCEVTCASRGLYDCSGVCTNLRETEYCGGCFYSCGDGEVCPYGYCMPDPSLGSGGSSSGGSGSGGDIGGDVGGSPSSGGSGSGGLLAGAGPL